MHVDQSIESSIDFIDSAYHPVGIYIGRMTFTRRKTKSNNYCGFVQIHVSVTEAYFTHVRFGWPLYADSVLTLSVTDLANSGVPMACYMPHVKFLP